MVCRCYRARRTGSTDTTESATLGDHLAEPSLRRKIHAHPHTASSAKDARRSKVEVTLVELLCAGRFIPEIRLEPVALLCAVDGESDIGAGQRKTKQDKLHQEPGPAAALAVAAHAARGLAGLGGGRTRGLAGVALVQVLCLDGDDVEVVAQLACFGAEAEVCDGRDFEIGDLEARRVFVLGLVLQLELEERVLEVGQARFGGDLGVADPAGLEG